jgi:hypothetical protein
MQAMRFLRRWAHSSCERMHRCVTTNERPMLEI